MKRDRVILRTWIAVLALLIVAQFVGNWMLAHWRAQDAMSSQPNPLYYRLGGH